MHHTWSLRTQPFVAKEFTWTTLNHPHDPNCSSQRWVHSSECLQKEILKDLEKVTGTELSTSIQRSYVTALQHCSRKQHWCTHDKNAICLNSVFCLQTLIFWHKWIQFTQHFTVLSSKTLFQWSQVASASAQLNLDFILKPQGFQHIWLSSGHEWTDLQKSCPKMSSNFKTVIPRSVTSVSRKRGKNDQLSDHLLSSAILALTLRHP